jgi:C1A family cysteine protease
MTSGQENALESAQNYVDLTAFSKAGLIEQLSSSAGEGFSKADATFAANNVDADWNEEAVEAAQNYLDLTAFSKAGLIEQLSSAAGEKFTPAQARYAVNKVY